MDTRMYVMTHKSIQKLPDDTYIPFHVGKKGKMDLGYPGDDTGEEISEKNPYYCELTGMYWIWKNVTCDIVGICHYRRFFVKEDELLSKSYIEMLMKNYSVIVPDSACVPKGSRVYEHYASRHYGKDLDLCREVIQENYPEYLDAFDFSMDSILVSMGNMWITRKDVYDRYCQWLFDILFEVEKRLDMIGYDSYQQRVFGFLSERLFRVWLLMQQENIREEKVELTEIDVLWKKKRLKELKRSGEEAVRPPKRLLFLSGLDETLDLFTEELNHAFVQLGYETLKLDVRNLHDDWARLAQFIKEPVIAAITFNSLGFNMELVEGQNIWEQLNIPCINILVEHPCCYHGALLKAPFNAVVLCADQNHMKYVGMNYPNISVTGFLPNAGCIQITPYKNMEERKIDVLFAGDLFVPENEKTQISLFTHPVINAKKMSKEILQDLLENPSYTTEEIVLKWLGGHDVHLTGEDFCLLMADIHDMEKTAVSCFCEQVLKSLVDSGVKITVYGKGWEKCDWINHPNLTYEGAMPAKKVLEEMNDAKIILNILRWFKDGTQSSVFDGMLAGAAVVTDTSKYMVENFREIEKLSDGSGYSTADAEIVFFELDKIQELEEKVKYLLGHLKEAQRIAEHGYQRAKKQHTWDVRAREIEEALF
ncbi:MAG: DUF4422 domain-containing protein [Lachnospiraceae bacterium]|nr:DUF4422 domain-containing protein [Lachnospiraceae bacterium]MDE6982332.1 DUF4422 domain-containing protein [Lachnospiraceae bacterium]